MTFTLEQVETNLFNLKNRLIEKKGEINNLTQQFKLKSQEIASLKDDEAILIQSKELLQETSEFAREEAKQIIESLVTKSLQYVFEDPGISFKVEIKTLKTRTDCNFYIVENGKERDPMDDNGGGLINIVSFILRIALIQASNKISLDEDSDEEAKIDAPLMLDEPFKELSAEYTPKMGKFLRELSEKLDMQIIIITHKTDMAKYADKKFYVYQDDQKVSHVKEVDTIRKEDVAEDIAS